MQAIVLNTSRFDVILNGSPQEILTRFSSLKDEPKVLFGAEEQPWPPAVDADSFPLPPNATNPYKFLNSGTIIGYAPELYALTSAQNISDNYDDQLHYSQLFLNNTLRSQLRWTLDYDRQLLKAMNEEIPDYKLVIDDPAHNHTAQIYINVNENMTTNPLVIHGNGQRQRPAINTLGNYLAKSWTVTDGCLACKENVRNVSDAKDLPVILVGVVKKYYRNGGHGQQIESFFKLTYPKDKIHLRVFDGFRVSRTQNASYFVARALRRHNYRSAKVGQMSAAEMRTEWLFSDVGRQLQHECEQLQCEFLIIFDKHVRFTNLDTLQLLVAQNRTMLAPMLLSSSRSDDAVLPEANFWDSADGIGRYGHGGDFKYIASRKKIGIWNVPCITSAIMFRADYLIANAKRIFDTTQPMGKQFRAVKLPPCPLSPDEAQPPDNDDDRDTVLSYVCQEARVLHPNADDFNFCTKARENELFMYVTNQHDYGYYLRGVANVYVDGLDKF